MFTYRHTAPEEPRQNPAVGGVENEFNGLAFFLGVMYLAPGGRSKKNSILRHLTAGKGVTGQVLPHSPMGTSHSMASVVTQTYNKKYTFNKLDLSK